MGRGAYCVDGEMVTCEEYCAQSPDPCGEGTCSNATTFEEQCIAWIWSTGAQPSTCEGTRDDACYKGLPPVSAVNGVFCVGGSLATCASYCQRSGLCPEGFCG